MNILPVQKSKLNRGLNTDQFFSPSVFVFDAHSCMVSPARLWELGVLCQQLGLLIAREEVSGKGLHFFEVSGNFTAFVCTRRLRANSSQDKAAYSPPRLSGPPG